MGTWVFCVPQSRKPKAAGSALGLVGEVHGLDGTNGVWGPYTLGKDGMEEKRLGEGR